MDGTIESALAQFEPDPDATFGFRSAQPGSRDADGELSWAADELRQMTPRSLP
jgi:hypothetical protein